MLPTMSRLAVRLIIPVLVVSFLPMACASAFRNATEKSYVPLLASRPDGSIQAPRGTLKGDFEWASDAISVEEAAFRWEQFLKAYEPPHGEYGDGFHKLHVDAAKLELMRVYYLLGRMQDGDRILKELDPLGLTTSGRPR